MQINAQSHNINQEDCQCSQCEKQQPLEDYMMIKTIGMGNFSKVKLAQHKETKQLVAIKILQKELIFQKKDIKRISLQIKIMKIIQHPILIQLYEIIQTTQHLYLILEYVEGGDLFDYIVSQKRINQYQAANLYSQIILGLQYLHSIGIAHRDLKPQNILIDRNGMLRIADLGLGNFYQKGQLLQSACGSPSYAPPQMLNKQSYNPQKSDVWSSGVILYAMVCGYLPWQDQITKILYEKIKNKPYKLPSLINMQCRNFISGLLSKNVDQRWSISTIKQHAFLTKHIKKVQQIIFNHSYHNIQKIQQVCQMTKIPEQVKLINYLLKNKHNNFTTLYYLTLKKIQGKRYSKVDKVMTNNELNCQNDKYEKEEKIQKKQNKMEVKNKTHQDIEDKHNQKEVINGDEILNDIQQQQNNTIKINEKQIQLQNLIKDKKDQQKQHQRKELKQNLQLIVKKYNKYDLKQEQQNQIKKQIDLKIQQKSINNQTNEYNQIIHRKQNQDSKLEENQDLIQDKYIQSNRNSEQYKNTKMIQKQLQNDIILPLQRQIINNKNKYKDTVNNEMNKSIDCNDKSVDRKLIRTKNKYQKQQKNKTMKLNQKKSKLIAINEKSYSKDKSNSIKKNLKSFNNQNNKHNIKIINVTKEPQLLQIDKLLLCSAQKLCHKLSQNGYIGQITVYTYQNNYIYINSHKLKKNKTKDIRIDINLILKQIRKYIQQE